MKKSIRLGLFILLGIPSQAALQAQHWHLLDKKTDTVQGMSVYKALNFLKAHKKKNQTVVVAIIDSGIDTLHEDLRGLMWRNEKEIPANGIDDDANGYVDDCRGWNFIGNANGKNMIKADYEAARLVHQLEPKWKDFDSSKTDSLIDKERKEYQTYLTAKKTTKPEQEEPNEQKKILDDLLRADSIIQAYLRKDEYTAKDLRDQDMGVLKNLLVEQVGRTGMAWIFGLKQESKANPGLTNRELREMIEKMFASTNPSKGEEKKQLGYIDYRQETIRDDYYNMQDKYYGNPDVMAKKSAHGTHVAGIIGANQNNIFPAFGIADKVQLMPVRAVPDGDEYDKDIANAIFYAVDNGAKIISMSFGKPFSPEKYWVDSAMRYADSKGVLMVHAAGNDNKNLDEENNYPCPLTLAGDRIKNFITVGSYTHGEHGEIARSTFSNYGKREVDVFAPGEDIFSTVTLAEGSYKEFSGTSMAAPAVSGLAALLMSYYPSLNATQIKGIIMKSVVVMNGKATNDLKQKCVSGGVVNAYQAVVLAEQITELKKISTAH